MDEYVVKLVRRPKEHPLAETLILEAGVDVAKPLDMVEVLRGLAGLIGETKTPEKAAEYWIDNMAAMNKIRKGR